MPALDYFFLLKQAENGAIYVATDGSVHFENRSHRVNEAVYATFSDDGIELPYHGIEMIMEDTYIYNQIRVSGDAFAEQIYNDTGSQTLFGLRVLNIDNSPLTLAANALALAEDLGLWYHSPALRIKELKVLPASSPAGLYPVCLGAEISHKLWLELSVASMAQLYWIDHISIDWDAQTRLWAFRWQLTTYGTLPA